MATLTEVDITSQFIGKTIDTENLTRCAQWNGPKPDGMEYIVYSCGFLYSKHLRETFGVTDQQKEMWERKGTEFNVHLHILDEKITFCQICKYHEGAGARPTYRSLKCTQQDLRIARNILHYICQP